LAKGPQSYNSPPLGKLGIEVGLGPEIISAVEEIFTKLTVLALTVLPAIRTSRGARFELCSFFL
jgi:hypothetical protein